MNVPETLISGFESRFINGLGFLPSVSSYGLQFPKFGVLNVLYVNVANHRYFGHIWPKLVRCLVSIFDSDLMPCSAWRDWWLYGATVLIWCCIYLISHEWRHECAILAHYNILWSTILCYDIVYESFSYLIWSSLVYRYSY